MEDIDTIKQQLIGVLRYRLYNADVFVSPCGFHYISYLDDIESISPDIDEADLNSEEINYIEQQLQSNEDRFDNQVVVVKRFVDINGKRVLDIGCGGGLFLSKMQDEGAEVTGVELSDSRAHYAATRHGIVIIKRPVEDGYWAEWRGSFDVVTLWDVIEHVNYPQATLAAAASLVGPGGLLLIETPCRDAFYHRAGALSYRLSYGKYPTFLNAMYSAHRFGHKQIFSTVEMQQLFKYVGVEVLELRKFHELSFPYIFYLKKLFKSDRMVRVALPFVNVALKVLPLRNKMLVVGRRE